MTTNRLILRSLRYYWRTNLAIALGVALAAAVITGSLLVGDSVTGSLRDTALARLGRIDHALISPAFFRAELASDLKRAASVAHISPTIITRGAAWNAESEEAVPAVQVIGVGGDFRRFFPGVPVPALSGRGVAINSALARDLKAQPGDALLLHAERYGAAPAGSLFAYRQREKTLRALRLRVEAVLPDGTGDFSLTPAPAVPRNLFISREWLTAQLGMGDVANTLLISSGKAPVQQRLGAVATLADYGLTLKPNSRQGYLSLESSALLLTRAQVAAAQQTADRCGAQAAVTSIYLATGMRHGEQHSAYALLAAVEPLRPLTFAAGGGKPLGPRDIILNRWLANDLVATVGDTLEVAYLAPSDDGEYPTRTMRLTVRGIVALDGPAADAGLAPDIAGITDADRVDEWNPPFPIDLRQVTPRDEEYWERYRTTPKAFISMAAAREMWGSGTPGGADWVTSLRLQPGEGDPAAFARTFSAALLRRLAPGENGLTVQPVRDMALASANGSTDFSQLFLGMSMFLVFAAAGLTGTLMRLAADGRAAQAGVMQACGFDARTAAGVIIGEGLVIALIGSALGLPLGLLYGWGIIHALTTWWAGAVGATVLWLHVTPVALLIGGVSGLVIGLLSILWGVRQLGTRRLLDLLAGWRGFTGQPEAAPRRGTAIAAVALPLLAAALVAAAWGGAISAHVAFFSSGALLLAAALCGSALGLTRLLGKRGRVPSLPLLALRNAAIHRGRSLLVIGLLAGASFILVTVAANRREARTPDRGSGGFALRAVSSLPVHYAIDSAAGREHLGFPAEDEALFRDVRVVPFLVSPGEDISCLNIARPAIPRLLGVDTKAMASSVFAIRTQAKARDPWTLLEGGNDAAIPVFGDADSVQWTLHAALGDTLTIAGPQGQPLTVHIVGLVKGSIFGSELLMSRAHFARLFPAIRTPRYFLIDVPAARAADVTASLRRNLGDLGMEVRATAEILNGLLAVQNTYLSTFLALGGLGMLLGACGLVIALLRNAAERRGEFALMLVTGFGARAIILLLTLENGVLLLTGLATGTLAALFATAPQLLASDAAVNWPALLAVLGGITALGWLSCAVAAHGAVRSDIIQSLREE